MSGPYNDFEDSYTIVSSSSVQRNPEHQDGDRTSVNSIILDSGEKSCKDFGAQEWIHLLVSLLSNCGYVAFVVSLLYKYNSESDHYVFSALIIIKFVFSTYFLFHGIFRQQPFQIVMQMLTSLSLWSLDLIYYLNDISNPPKKTDEEVRNLDHIGLELTLFYFRSIFCLLNLLTGCIITWKYWTIEQAIFKTVGTDMRRVHVFRNLFFGFSLMIFDMETSLVSLLLFMRNGFTSLLASEIGVLASGFCFLSVWVFLGYRAMRSESRGLTWAFVLVSCIQPVYLVVLFIRNIKFTGSSQPVLTATSHYMFFVTLIVHFSVVAAVVVASHYYGGGYGNALVDGVHVSVKNSSEYENLRRILFHPINRNQHDPNSSRTILLNAEVY